jgi:hypothetical protein
MTTKSVQRVVYWYQEGNRELMRRSKYRSMRGDAVDTADGSGVDESHAGIVDKTPFEKRHSRIATVADSRVSAKTVMWFESNVAAE